MDAETKQVVSHTQQAIDKLIADWLRMNANNGASYRAGAFGMLYSLWLNGLISYDVYKELSVGLDAMPKIEW